MADFLESTVPLHLAHLPNCPFLDILEPPSKLGRMPAVEARIDRSEVIFIRLASGNEIE